MWCTTECWDCEDRKCEHYISKTELYFENQKLKDQLQQKENIIKEARECIEQYNIIRGYYEYEEDGYDEYNYDEDVKQELLETLDKENKQ